MRSASSSQRANSLVPSATVGVAISNSAITMGAIFTFSMASSQDRRLGVVIVTYTDFAHHTKKANNDFYSPSTYVQLGSATDSRTSAKDELLDRNLLR